MEYFLFIAIFVAIYGILALSLNLITGYTGLISLAHAAFFGIGAYTVAVLTTTFGLNFFFALAIGIVYALALSFIVGVIFSRLGGDYYVLGTVGFNYIVWTVMLNWDSVTHGPLGVSNIPRPAFFGLLFNSNEKFFLLALSIFVIVYLFSRFLVRSSFGRILKAIREDERAIAVFGYRTLWYKVLVFMIAAAAASVAGGLYASYIAYIDPTTFMVAESIFILSIVIVGGLANLEGSILGAVFLVLLPEALRFVGFSADIAAQMRQAIYGLLLILAMLYRPQGLIGEYKL